METQIFYLSSLGSEWYYHSGNNVGPRALGRKNGPVKADENNVLILHWNEQIKLNFFVFLFNPGLCMAYGQKNCSYKSSY